MPMMLRAAGKSLVVIACLTAASCQSPSTSGRRQSGSPTRLPAKQVQTELMTFADSYTAILTQAVDQVTRELPEQRAVLHDLKLRCAMNAIINAAGPNPIGGLLDMTVMVTLQREVAEEYWIPQRFGDAGLPLVEGLRQVEREIWLVAERSLDEQQVEALRALIPQIRDRFRGQVLVSSIRASEFAYDRRAVVANLEGGGSLLTLFQLDPLAGLSPAAQELAQSRLLAERAFFWAKRVPAIVNWQLQDVILETLAEPETQQIVAAAAGLTESSRRLSDVAEELPQWLAEERAAAVDQINALMATEREAALSQAFEGIATEREAILRTFEQEDVRLRGLLDDMRQTIESGTALSEALTTTIESIERLRTSASRPPGEPRPEGRPFDIADYQATAEAMTATAEQLNHTIVSLTELIDSPAWEERNSQLAAATDRAQTSLEQLIDRSYRRGLILIGVLIVGVLVAALVYRLISARLVAPQSDRAS